MNRYKIFFLLAVVLLASCKSPFEKIDPSERDADNNFWSNLASSNYDYSNADKYEVGDAVITANVQTIDVDWIFGSVKVAYGDGNELRCSEQIDNPNDTTRMRYWLDGTTLHIRFCRSGEVPSKLKQKDLTILLPKETEPNLKITTVSANVEIEKINAKDVEMVVVSGNVLLTGCTTMNVDVESFSGDVKLSASSCNDVTVETVSGEVHLGNVKSVSCDVETVSGNVNLRTDEKNLAVSFATVSGDFDSKIPFTKNGDVYKMGNGSVKIEVETVSGDLTVKE